MPKSRLETFTDRHEAIALFDQLRGPNPDITWPLLPILAFIAPGGSGKSTLIEYLRVNKCCLSDRRQFSPMLLLILPWRARQKTCFPFSSRFVTNFSNTMMDRASICHSHVSILAH